MKKSFAYPYGVWMAIFIIAPILLVVLYAFQTSDGGFTLANFSYLPGYLPIFGRSFWLALLSTAVCLALGYPMAYIMSRLSPSRQSLCMMLIMLPMWMNFLLRTYAWMSILENNGFINGFFRSIGLISFLQTHFGYTLDYIPLINTQGAIVLGMVYNFLPFMVLPIYTVLIKLDRRLIEAAQDLGAVLEEVLRAARSRAGQLNVERAGDAARTRRHDNDLVREVNRLVYVMRYHDGGHAGLLPDAQDFVLHIHAGEGVECAERLVEQQHLGPADKGACERGALAHAARKLMRIGLLEALEADHFDEFIDAVLFLLVDAAGTQAERDIVIDGQPREQRVLLKHEAAVRAGGGDGRAVERQLALVHLDEAGDQTQERRFAAAGRADERHERASGNIERNIVERGDALAGRIDKVLGNARNGDASYHLITPFCHARTWSRNLKSRVMRMKNVTAMMIRPA